MTPTPWVTDEEAIKYLKLDHLKNAREMLHRRYRNGKIRAVLEGRRYLTTIKWLESGIMGQREIA